jgi:hypothetical protein
MEVKKKRRITPPKRRTSISIEKKLWLLLDTTPLMDKIKFLEPENHALNVDPVTSWLNTWTDITVEDAI